MWPWRSRRYIAFARKFQPVLTADAADYLVNAYRQLRQRDGGSTMSASRITVRQLESLIRLAEANARLACLSQVAIHLENKKKPTDKTWHRQSTSIVTTFVHQVTKEHVKEAYRLLNKSIIRVEEPDIDLDDQVWILFRCFPFVRL